MLNNLKTFVRTFSWVGGDQLYAPCYAYISARDSDTSLVCRILDVGPDETGRPHTFRLEGALLETSPDTEWLASVLRPEAWPQEPLNIENARIHPIVSLNPVVSPPREEIREIQEALEGKPANPVVIGNETTFQVSNATVINRPFPPIRVASAPRKRTANPQNVQRPTALQDTSQGSLPSNRPTGKERRLFGKMVIVVLLLATGWLGYLYMEADNERLEYNRRLQEREDRLLHILEEETAGVEIDSTNAPGQDFEQQLRYVVRELSQKLQEQQETIDRMRNLVDSL